MAKKNSLLWEIHDNKVFKGYLFGSMHVPAELAFDNLKPIHSAIDSCDLLATEIPLDSKSQFEMGKHMKLPSNVSLRNLLSEKKYEKLDLLLQKSFHISLDQFSGLLPLFLLNFMTQSAIDSDSQKNPSSMDLELWNYAKLKGKDLGGVETIKDHIDTLYNIPLEYQLKALKEALRNVSKFRKKSNKMLALYKSQDIHKLYKQSKKSLEGIREVLLYRRNEIMLFNISEILEAKSAFFVVGAGHLSGKKGLIHGLKEKGFTLKAKSI